METMLKLYTSLVPRVSHLPAPSDRSEGGETLAGSGHLLLWNLEHQGGARVVQKLWWLVKIAIYSTWVHWLLKDNIHTFFGIGVTRKEIAAGYMYLKFFWLLFGRTLEGSPLIGQFSRVELCQIQSMRCDCHYQQCFFQAALLNSIYSNVFLKVMLVCLVGMLLPSY